jgi:hypothetical protein
VFLPQQGPSGETAQKRMGLVKEGGIRNERGLFITHIYFIYFDINGIKGDYYLLTYSMEQSPS